MVGTKTITAPTLQTIQITVGTQLPIVPKNSLLDLTTDIMTGTQFSINAKGVNHARIVVSTAWLEPSVKSDCKAQASSDHRPRMNEAAPQISS